MSFLRHGEIYRPMKVRERPAHNRPRPHRYDEFPAGYSLAGCAPAEPASASPAGRHRAATMFGSTIKMQRAANQLLTACLTQGDNPKRKRIVVDLIAGMTEPQAIAGYAQLMGVQPTVTLEEIVR